MCEWVVKQTPHGNGVDLDITCATSGKPITVTNKYGTFCEDLCDLEDCKKAKVVIDKLMKGVHSLLNEAQKEWRDASRQNKKHQKPHQRRRTSAH